MLRRGAPEEPEWYRTATRSIALAEQEARTDSRQKVLAQQRAYEAQQQAAARAAAQHHANRAFAQQQAHHQQAQHHANRAFAQQQAHHQQAQHRARLQQQQYTAHYVTERAHTNPTPRPTLRTRLLAGIVTVASLVLLLIFTLYYGAAFGIVLTLVSLPGRPHPADARRADLPVARPLRGRTTGVTCSPPSSTERWGRPSRPSSAT
uniref:Uncharacterized protein n=1 Tax=Janibacter limosus TaxID=53458 RepID=A0AC61U202_9MICO|nr:hypothetical protein [Janibacter limosus]